MNSRIILISILIIFSFNFPSGKKGNVNLQGKWGLAEKKITLPKKCYEGYFEFAADSTYRTVSGDLITEAKYNLEISDDGYLIKTFDNKFKGKRNCQGVSRATVLHNIRNSFYMRFKGDTLYQYDGNDTNATFIKLTRREELKKSPPDTTKIN